MGANKFATFLHKNTNKMTLILVYAVLEWTLIILLFLNSLFSYFIVKFANYFGLKPPCFSCARIDRYFDPKSKNSHTDLLCELHAKEISQLGYCLNHKKLAESKSLCEDCSNSEAGCQKDSKSFVFPQVNKMDFEEDEVSLTCSCCGVDFLRRIFDDSSYFVIHPSWDLFEFSKKGNLIEKIADDDLIGSDLKDDQIAEKKESQLTFEVKETEIEAMKEDNYNVTARDSNYFEEDLIQFEKIETEKDYSNQENHSQDLEFFFDHTGSQLVPIELIDSTTDEIQNDSEIDEDHKFGEFQKAQIVLKQQTETVTEELVQETQEFVSAHHKTEKFVSEFEEKTEESSKFVELDSMEMEETENSLVFHANTSNFPNEKPEISQKTGETRALNTEELEENAEESDSDSHSVHDEKSQSQLTDNEEAEVSIGTEIPVLDFSDEIKAQDNFSLYSSTNSHDLQFDVECDFKESQEDEMPRELKNLEVENVNEIEDEKIPDTPTSIDSLNQLHKKFLMLERDESGAEESFDGSVVSEMDGATTTEKLKSALKAERKALHALYTELEEERSASAVAANQTMAMINRLQEEKAAMQMEALQYQRMMEEQSEYDQEALQLLNELMTKREKENQELERELESYRKKVLDYERARGAKTAACSASCSHSEDGMSFDEAKEDGSFDRNHEFRHQNTPIDDVLNLESSLADFEDERMSILEQLKVLEEKLVTLSDEEDRHFADIRPIEDYYEENGKHLNGIHDFDMEEVDGIGNGFTNGKIHRDRRSIGSTGKRLLPLFDTIDMESEDGMMASNGTENENENENGNGFHPNKVENAAVTRFELEKKRIDIEEEVDQLYGRLQALEADREFLKHCIGSLKKGDKGMELLQEILQHLRDLRNVDLRAKSFTDGVIV